MTASDYFASLARYHAWATHKLLTQELAPLSDDEWHRDVRLFFGSVHRTVNHLLVADILWYARFADNPPQRIALDAELHTNRAELCAAVATAANRWAPWVAAMDATRLDGDLVYTRSDGVTARIPYAPALGHVFNHATHHRGQITAGVTTMGHPGPSLDWASLLQLEVRRA